MMITKTKERKPRVLDKCKVVITKNPCHHPGDIRTFTAVNYPRSCQTSERCYCLSRNKVKDQLHMISVDQIWMEMNIWLFGINISFHMSTNNAQPYRL